MQVRPLDVMKSKFWFDQFERERTNVYVQRAVEIAVEVQSALFEDRSLSPQRAVRIIRGGAGDGAVALNEDAAQRCPLDGHVLDFTSRLNWRGKAEPPTTCLLQSLPI